MSFGTVTSQGLNTAPISEAYMRSDGAEKLGISRKRLFDASYIDPVIQNEISVAQMVLLSMNTISETGDFLLGLGRKPIPASQLILVLRIMMGCTTVDRGLHSVAHFHELGHPISVGLKSEAGVSQFWVSCDDGFGLSNARSIEDIYINIVFSALCYFLGRRFPVFAVTTRNDLQLTNTRHWSMYAPVRRGTLAALHFDTSLLCEHRQGDPTDEIFWSILHDKIALHASHQEPAPGDAVSIRRLNTLSLCHELGISTATFRRRNQSSGGTFRRFREETLVEASLKLLADGTQSVSSIASQLGYADVSSYRRFIKGATGRTPDQLRTEAHALVIDNVQPQVIIAIRNIADKLSQ